MLVHVKQAGAVDQSEPLDDASLSFEELEAYMKAQGISCHRAGLFAAYNFFRAERGFGVER